jgi:drug/metabolite transporter (DMT)-like permease
MSGLFYVKFMSKKIQYTLIIHIVVIIWGYTGIMGKAITLPATEMVWWRMGIAVISLGLLFPFIQRKYASISGDLWLKTLFVGVLVGLHWITFFHSIKMSSISLGIICLATTTLHVSWLEPLIKKTKFNVLDLILSIVVFGGMFLISTQQSANIQAIIVGLLSAFLAALFSVSNAVLVEKMPSPQLTLIELSSGFVVLTLFLLFQGDLNIGLFQKIDADLFWKLLFLGVVCTSIAFILAVNATKHLGAFTVSLTINLEPVYTIILALLIYPGSEKMDPLFYVGSAIIVSAVVTNGIIKNRQRRKANRLDLA